MILFLSIIGISLYCAIGAVLAGYVMLFAFDDPFIDKITIVITWVVLISILIFWPIWMIYGIGSILKKERERKRNDKRN